LTALVVIIGVGHATVKGNLRGSVGVQEASRCSGKVSLPFPALTGEAQGGMIRFVVFFKRSLAAEVPLTRNPVAT
jgi:hypothetical protein